MSITCQKNTILVYIGLNKFSLFLFSFVVWWLEHLKSQTRFCSTSVGRAAEIVAQLPPAPHSALRRSPPLITPPIPLSPYPAVLWFIALTLPDFTFVIFLSLPPEWKAGTLGDFVLTELTIMCGPNRCPINICWMSEFIHQYDYIRESCSWIDDPGLYFINN